MSQTAKTANEPFMCGTGQKHYPDVRFWVLTTYLSRLSPETCLSEFTSSIVKDKAFFDQFPGYQAGACFYPSLDRRPHAATACGPTAIKGEHFLCGGFGFGLGGGADCKAKPDFGCFVGRHFAPEVAGVVPKT